MKHGKFILALVVIVLIFFPTITITVPDHEQSPEELQGDCEEAEGTKNEKA